MKPIGEIEFFEDRGSFEEFSGLDLDLLDRWPKKPERTAAGGRWLEIAPGRHIVGDVELRDCPGAADSKPIMPLARRRWHVANLCPDEERALVVRAQAGEESAKCKLHICFHKLILKLVSQRQRLLKEAGTTAQEMEAAGLDFAELIAVGHLAFIEAVQRFDVATGNRLASYVRTCIRGQLLNWVKTAARAGICGYMPAGTWINLAEYSEQPFEHRDAKREPISNGNESDAWLSAGLGDRFGIERGRLLATEMLVLRSVGVQASRHDLPFALERLAEDQDRRLARFVALVGRRRAAQVMVKREHQRIARRSDEAQYLYHDVARLGTPHDSRLSDLQREIADARKPSSTENRRRCDELWEQRQLRLEARRQRRLKEMGAQATIQSQTAADVARISKTANAMERTITLQQMCRETPTPDASRLARRTKDHDDFESNRSVSAH